MAMAVHHHVNRLRWCGTESAAFDDDDELLHNYRLSDPLISPNNSLISDQEAYDCGGISLIVYCPPSNSCGKVLQFDDCLPDDDSVDDSLQNLPDLSTLDVRVFNEFIDSIDSCSSAPAPAHVCPKSTDSRAIDLPDLVDRPARSACMISASVSCSSALVSHGEIKDVISCTDGGDNCKPCKKQRSLSGAGDNCKPAHTTVALISPANPPKKQRSLSYAGDDCKPAHTTTAALISPANPPKRQRSLSYPGHNRKLAHTTAALMESASWADARNGASPVQAIASSPATPHLPRPRIDSTVQAAETSIQANGDNSKVTLCVKTDTFNLLDGYTWRKYGEKRIENQKFTRSYFRCAESGCGVKKRTERCSRRQEYVLFTYLGRHNHHT